MEEHASGMRFVPDVYIFSKKDLCVSLKFYIFMLQI